MKPILFSLLLPVVACFPLLAQKANDKDPNAQYVLGPDSLPKDGVPHGKVIAMEPWKSKIYDGTVRDWWIYVPAQYDGSKPAAVMVFQDGGKAKPEDKNFAGPNNAVFVFDNLIHAKEMPVTIGIFISPGNFPDGTPGKPRSNRSFEYDTPDGSMRVPAGGNPSRGGEEYKLTDKPEERAHRRRQQRRHLRLHRRLGTARRRFNKVVSHIGSFTNIRGGYIYPAAIRKTKPGLAPRAANPIPRRSRSSSLNCAATFASSSRTAETISTTSSATGPWPTRTWPPR